MGKGQFVLCFIPHHPRKWEQELQAGSRAKTMEECFFLACSFCLLSLLSYIAKPTWLGMVPSTVCWALSYLSLIKMCHRLYLQANLMEAISHLKLCLHRYVKGLYRVERKQPAHPTTFWRSLGISSPLLHVHCRYSSRFLEGGCSHLCIWESSCLIICRSWVIADS